jgi:Ni2+-binding GTPase involved in maturation of urease and hydrogenase
MLLASLQLQWWIAGMGPPGSGRTEALMTVVELRTLRFPL